MSPQRAPASTSYRAVRTRTREFGAHKDQQSQVRGVACKRRATEGTEWAPSLLFVGRTNARREGLELWLPSEAWCSGDRIKGRARIARMKRSTRVLEREGGERGSVGPASRLRQRPVAGADAVEQMYITLRCISAPRSRILRFVEGARREARVGEAEHRGRLLLVPIESVWVQARL